LEDRARYQTVYATHAGSLAAPTAGLHFTPELLTELEERGCEIARLTLTVGLGTFIPIRGAAPEEHRMETERYEIPAAAAAAMARARGEGRPVTAVGTTVVRALESAADAEGAVRAGGGVARLFIRPPYDFKVTRRLITNFHRPDSTLIQMVAALIGWDLVNLAYQAALDNGFRFYSYGDAMLIL
jgi:S-adenosylmethionine:tRNA ribosyltransferase-isomerase